MVSHIQRKALLPRSLALRLKEHDDEKAHEGEGDVAVDAPRERRTCAHPLILRHHAENDARGGKTLHGGDQARPALDLIALAPHIIEQHIKDRH